MIKKLLSAQEIFVRLKAKYGQYSPDFELMIKAEQIEKLNSLVTTKNAVLLKHNYMTWDLQCEEVLGFCGDSLELSRKAAETTADIIVFLGVKFMAETAKILNPQKKVLIPSLKAGCSLASSITGADVRQLKKMFPGVPVIAYVNTDADTKSEIDICCASGNAIKVVKWALQEWQTKTVIFLPDMFLAKNVARELKASIIFPTRDGKLKADVPLESGLTIIGWPGKCEVHEKFTPQDVTDLKKDYPGLYIMAHPECPPEVVEKVDFAGSTAQMLQNITSPVVQKKQVALLTECAMVEMLAATHPNVLQVCSIQRRCPHMAQNSLETVIAALENEQFEITVPENIRKKAEVPIRRMIAIK